MKKAFSFVLAVVMLLSVMSMPVFAAENDSSRAISGCVNGQHTLLSKTQAYYFDCSISHRVDLWTLDECIRCGYTCNEEFLTSHYEEHSFNFTSTDENLSQCICGHSEDNLNSSTYVEDE